MKWIFKLLYLQLIHPKSLIYIDQKTTSGQHYLQAIFNCDVDIKDDEIILKLNK